jgi:hypothetical protein
VRLKLNAIKMLSPKLISSVTTARIMILRPSA